MNVIESLVAMNNFKIIKSAHYLPSKKLNNQYFESYLDTSDEWITKRTGIKSRSITSGQMTELVDGLLEQVEFTNSELASITKVVVATSSNTKIMPNVASYVHYKLNLNSECLCFDINTACSGFTSSLNLVKDLFTSCEECILVLGIDQMSNIIDYDDRNTCILFGDGAGLMLLKGSSEQHILASKVTCNYDFEHVLTTKNNKIIMNGQEVFKYAVKDVCHHLSELLEMANLSSRELDYVVCHQANERILSAIKRQFKLSDEQVLSTIAFSANTSSASIPICFDYHKDKFKPNNNIAMIGFGAGLITSSMLYKI